MRDLILDVRRLSKSYATVHGELTVLHQVSFGLEAGETMAILGPSGSGKTTLLGLCAGLDRPSEGSVSVNGVELTEQDEDGLAQLRNDQIGFIFQNFQLLPTLTALENVMVPLELRGEPAGERATELLDQVGLGDRVDHYPVQLSGGEQQRVAIARAFINRPRLLFADEPTGNLDGATAEVIRELLFEIHGRAEASLVMVTHDESLARRTGKILRLANGRVVAEELV
ncbi:MAG: ATP-binding cassette domain-containing protein [Acidobacteria bacterium]|nr:ATP-binding cassette domain-containing protein [Acidobacteriota bacterium]